MCIRDRLAIATLAPSRAARSAIASPMPRLAPEMNSVLPLSDGRRTSWGGSTSRRLPPVYKRQGAVTRRPQRDREPNAAARTRDEQRLAFERCHENLL